MLKNLPLEQHYRDARCGSLMLPVERRGLPRPPRAASACSTMSETGPRDVDAAPVAWREAGAGPTVVFLHGLGMTRTGFDPQLAALADRFRCVAWDMPGYGASPPRPAPLTFAALADAVDGLLDALERGRRAPRRPLASAA